MWLETWRDHPDLRAGVRRVWTEAANQLINTPVEHRSRKVRGPMTAVMLHLIESGWQIGEATSWAIPEPHPAAGDEWRFDDAMFSGLQAAGKSTEFLKDFKG
eukprot:2230090-Pyramimonas_sp.AAC.1